MKFQYMTSSITIFIIVAAVNAHLLVANQITVEVLPELEQNEVLAERFDDVSGRHLLAVARSSSGVDGDWRVAVEDTLNNWRRTVYASNMHYTSYDDDLELASSTVFSSCQAKSSITLDDSRYKFASGLYGAMSLDSDIVKELRRLTEQGVTGKQFARLILWSMVGVGCHVYERRQCVLSGSNGTTRVDVKPYACVFAYTSAMSSNVYAVTGVNCSMCDSGDLWCDDGLCRGSCRPNDPECARCEDSCSRCSGVTAFPDCQCLCYYENGSRRCQATAASSPYQPICYETEPDNNSNQLFHAPAWVTAIIVVSCLLVSVAFAMATAYCIIHCNKSHRQDSQDSPPPPDYDSQNITHDNPFFPVTSLPPYLDGKPPEYTETTSHQCELNDLSAGYDLVQSMSSSEEESQHYDAVSHVITMGTAPPRAAAAAVAVSAINGDNPPRELVYQDTPDNEVLCVYDNLVCSTTSEEQ